MTGGGGGQTGEPGQPVEDEVVEAGRVHDVETQQDDVDIPGLGEIAVSPGTADLLYDEGDHSPLHQAGPHVIGCTGVGGS